MQSALAIAHQRLHHQHIAHSPFAEPHQVVQWLGALQAQDYASAEWTIGLRLNNGSPTRIAEAIANKTIVRTWLLRGTLHIVAAADLRWMAALLGPPLLTHYSRVYRQMGLDEETTAKGLVALERVLQEGPPLIRKELAAALEPFGVKLAPMQMSQLLNCAALAGLICLGAPQGKQNTYVLLDRWLDDDAPASQKLEQDEALAEFALRYFTSHGPATLHDFAWWTGLSIKDARSGLDGVKDQLVEEKFAGKSYWLSPSPISAGADSAAAYLLPGFDEYILGYADRSAVLEAQHLPVITGRNAVFAYTMVWDGQVVGTWKRTIGKAAVNLTFSPFAPLPPEVMQAFTPPAQRYAKFLGLPVEIH